jgi:hypothetical protein
MTTDGRPEHETDGPIRGEVRLVGFRRVSHGLFLRVRPGLTDDEEFKRDLRAWREVLPGDAVFTHVTAARLRGWQLPALPPQVPVFVAVSGDQRRPRRPGLICSRLVRPSPSIEVNDGPALPVDAAEEIMLRAARDLGTLDLTIMIDSGRRLGAFDDSRVHRLLGSRRPGVRQLRAAWAASDPRADSAGETVLRLFHDAMDVPVKPQAQLHGPHGELLGVADLWVIGTTSLHEYDGAGHREGPQHRTDLRRERGLAGTSYVRRGFTLDDLLNHPLVVMHELDRLLDRPHRLTRLKRWQQLVENSLYSDIGRERVLNRWYRAIGLIDWSRTA